MFYVYVLQNERLATYIGSTNDLRRRFKEHALGKAAATRDHVWHLVYYEAYGAEQDAREREHQLKYRGQAKAQLKRRLKHTLKS